MPDEVALSAAVRSSLLSLKNTSSLIERTQGRLSTGLRVASATDDAVAFFQAKALSDRASDFSEKKDGIDQGVSTVMTALTAVEGVEHLVQQLKGLGQAMKSATGDQFTDLLRQFNGIRTQISRLTADATYQGVNLVNGSGQILEVEFSNRSDSLLRVESIDLTYEGLSVGEIAAAATGDSVIEAAFPTAGISHNNDRVSDLGWHQGYRIHRVSGASELRFGVNLTYQGKDDVFTAGGSYEAAYGTGVYQILAAQDVTVTQGAEITLMIVTAAGGPSHPVARNVRNHDLLRNPGHSESVLITSLFIVIEDAIDTAAVAKEYLTEHSRHVNYVSEGDTDSVNAVIDELDAALTSLRGDAAMLGSNVALLKTRLEFTEDYVNTLGGGAGKLTLADINEEGANLLALQTRQQLGVSALAFAGQAEQSILALFN